VPGLAVTLSLGIASFPMHGRDAATLLKRADQALYRSKVEGRDRYAVWDDSLDRVGWRADPLAGILTGNLARDHRNVQILLETIDLVRSAADFGSVVARAMDYILEFTGAARVLLFQTDPAGALELANARLRGGVAAEAADLKYSRSVPDTAVREKRSMCIIDSADGLSGPIVRSTSMDSLRLKTVMCVPLEMREECVGAIYVDDKIANKEFKQEDLVFLEAIAKQLGMAIASREAVSSSGAFRAPWSEGGPPPSRAHRAEMDALRLENERLRQRLADNGLDSD